MHEEAELLAERGVCTSLNERGARLRPRSAGPGACLNRDYGLRNRTAS